MLLAILQFELAIPDPESLKDKRRVVKSLKDRLHREHMASVAEIAAQDDMSRAVLGLALVGTDGKHLGTVLDHITEKLRAMTDAELVSCRRRMIREADLPDDAEEPIDEEAIAQEMLRRAQEPD